MTRVSVPSLREYYLLGWGFPIIALIFPILAIVFKADAKSLCISFLIPVIVIIYPASIFLLAFRNLWHVFVEGENLLIKKGKKEIRLTLRDIYTINQTYARRNLPRPRLFSNDNRMVTVKLVTLNHPVDGITKFRYVATEEDEKDDELLIKPWKNLYREWVQESLKKRGERR